MSADQRAFDVVYRHLLKQGRPALLPGGSSCVYRTAYGLRCAVGVLIADEHYYDGLETLGADTKQVVRAVTESGYEGISVRLLDRLQAIHDGQHVDNWKCELELVADEFDLDIPEDAG